MEKCFPDLNILVSVPGRSSCRITRSLIRVRGVTSPRLRDQLLHFTTRIRLAVGALAAAAVGDAAGEEPDQLLEPVVGADLLGDRLHPLGPLAGVGDTPLVVVHG